MKLYIDENNKVVTMHEATSDMKCFEEFENRKPYSFDGVKELENCIHPIHVLLNTSMILNSYKSTFHQSYSYSIKHE